MPFTCSLFYTGEWVCTLKIAYPFIRHFPIAVAMSISHISGCARICGIRRERETVGYKRRVGSRRGHDRQWGDTPAQPQPHAMGAARRDPRRGENPVELVAASRLMTSLKKAGVSRTNRLALNNWPDGRTGS